MKTTSTLIGTALITLLGIALALPVSAQPGPGMGGGPGMQHGQDHMGHGGRGMRFNQDKPRGWSLMTPAERDAQRIKMREVKTFDECTALQAEHRSIMEARAKEKGVTLPTPRRNVCENMKARGFIK